MNHSYQTQALKQAKQGHISAGIDILQEQIKLKGKTYSVCSNLAALYLQLGDYHAAITSSTQAILIDPFSYIAYFNRFLCYLSTEQLLLSWKDIQKVLSCLNMMKGLKEGKVTFVNKAILYWEHNIRAYLIRAKMNEGRNNKLAENDYSAAVEYAPNYPLIYQQRALFFRKLNRKREFEDDLAKFIALNELNKKNNYQFVDNENEEDVLLLNQKIVECIRQYKELMADKLIQKDTAKSINKQPIIYKQPLNDIEDEQLLLNSVSGSLSAQKISVQNQQADSSIRQNNINQPFVDEKTEDLNDQIQRLQQQIEAEGGKLTLYKELNSELQVSNQNTFYSTQIEQTTQEINRLTNKQTFNQIRTQGKLISPKLGEPRQLTSDQFANYTRFSLEIISLQDLQNPNMKELATVQVQYGDNTFQTSTNRFEWREEFVSQIFQDLSQVQVNVLLKGGMFTSSTFLGQGAIDIRQSGNTRCVLANKQTKTAILYFKLKLF